MVRQIDLDAYEQGVLAADRRYLGQAITLVESTHPDHRPLAEELLTRLLPHAVASHRVGITGVPGVGKSTFIDALGTMLTGDDHKVAVLAVDPSSTRTGGSILGDKTRMERLSVDPDAFIRPSPTSGTLGGVAAATREAIVIVEAAGHDVVLVETVGVGQSETTVANLTDTFLVLMLARTGDSLQGIKKGVLELADVVTVNKADGPHLAEAKVAARELSTALELLYPPGVTWIPPVLTCSAATGDGLADVWGQVTRHRTTMESTGAFAARRADQQVSWMWSSVEESVLRIVPPAALRARPGRGDRGRTPGRHDHPGDRRPPPPRHGLTGPRFARDLSPREPGCRHQAFEREERGERHEEQRVREGHQHQRGDADVHQPRRADPHVAEPPAEQRDRAPPTRSRLRRRRAAGTSTPGARRPRRGVTVCRRADRASRPSRRRGCATRRRRSSRGRRSGAWRSRRSRR